MNTYTFVIAYRARGTSALRAWCELNHDFQTGARRDLGRMPPQRSRRAFKRLQNERRAPVEATIKERKCKTFI